MAVYLWILLGIAIAYPILILAIYMVQEFFLFHPEILPQDFKFDYSQPFEELYFRTEEDVSINGLLFKVPDPKGVVYYFHGNTRSIKGWAKFSRDFTGKGYDVLMIDYRGFGKSVGKRTEKGLHHDAQYVYEWLAQRYGESHIIVYGRSMGSGFAAKVASSNAPQMLILDAPYYSMLNLIHGYLLKIFPTKKILRYHIRTDEYLKQVKCPVHIFHGTRDITVPFISGLRLYRLVKEGKFISIRGGGHNNLRDFPKYHEYLYYLLGVLPINEQKGQGVLSLSMAAGSSNRGSGMLGIS